MKRIRNLSLRFRRLVTRSWSVTLFLIAISALVSEAAPFAYVANLADGVSVVNTGTNAVVASVAVGVGPQGVAVTPDGRFAYVANFSSGNVSVIDTALINTPQNPVVATVPVGEGPLGVAITPDGTFAYVTVFGHLCNNGGVWVIDTVTNAVVPGMNGQPPTVPLAGCTTGVAVTPDGALAYVTNNTSSTVSVIDTGTNRVVRTVQVGSSPYGVAITPDGAFAYVTHRASPPDPSANTVSVIDIGTDSVAAVVAVGVEPHGVAITPNGAFAYVANFGSNDVSVIDTTTNTVSATVVVEIAPQGVAVTPDGSFAYVTNSGSNSVSVIDTSAPAVVATVGNAGASPQGIAIANLDRTPPDTSISSGPAEGSFTNSTQATLAFTGTDDRSAPSALTFSCSLDGDPYASCASPQTYSGLAEGRHTFAVRAIDEAGNVDPAPAIRTWTVDTTPPLVFLSVAPQILWPPNHQLVKIKVTVSASDQNGPASIMLANVACSEMDRGACAADDIQGADVGTLDTDLLLRGTRTGGSVRTYTLTYQATDLAGNTGIGSVTVTVPANSP